MKKLNAKEKQVLDLIPKDDRRLPISEITKLTGIAKRDLYDIIERLRSYGVPIVASRNSHRYGYYIASNKAELNEGIVPYKRQAQKMNMTINFLEKADTKNWQEGIKK